MRRYHHIGIPTAESKPGEAHLKHLKLFVVSHQKSEFSRRTNREVSVKIIGQGDIDRVDGAAAQKVVISVVGNRLGIERVKGPVRKAYLPAEAGYFWCPWCRSGAL